MLAQSWREKPLWWIALLVAAIKLAEYLADHTPLFFLDSTAFVLNALGTHFLPERSYTYGWLIRAVALPFHSALPIVVAQMVMGGIVAWLLAFTLVRFFGIRPSVAAVAAAVFALDPTQVVHEHLFMTEASAMFAGAIYVVMALQYFRDRNWGWLVALAFAGIVLVSLRMVYLPPVLVCSLAIPLIGYWNARSSVRALLVALSVSIACTAAAQIGYRDLTGYYAGHEPAYHYKNGFFLVSEVSPLLKPEDTDDPRAAAALPPRPGDTPLDKDLGTDLQMWFPQGLVQRLKDAFGGDEVAANQAAYRMARHAILRDPFGYLRLVARMGKAFAVQSFHYAGPLQIEDGLWLSLPAHDVEVLRGTFRVDTSRNHELQTPTRRYHVLLGSYTLLLLFSPVLFVLLCWLGWRGHAVSLLFIGLWGLLLGTSTLIGAPSPALRYLNPFSFMALASAAFLVDKERSRWEPVVRLIGVQFQRPPLLVAAAIVAAIKLVELWIDHTPLFYYDSGAFIVNAVGDGFLPDRSFTYGYLIRLICLPFSTWKPLLIAQVMMGGVTAWLLAFLLMRYTRVRPWLAIVAAIGFALDPVQIVHERLVMTEQSAMFVGAIYIVMTLEYLRDRRPAWLAALAAVGILLASVRLVYVPVVLVCSVLIPTLGYLVDPIRRRRTTLAALAVSVGCTAVLHLGYRAYTGREAGHPPAYSYWDGFLLTAKLAPYLQSSDADDPRAAAALVPRTKEDIALSDTNSPARQAWRQGGLGDRLRTAFAGDDFAANQAALHMAKNAIVRNPMSFVKLGMGVFAGFWNSTHHYRTMLSIEDGLAPEPELLPSDFKRISYYLHHDASDNHTRWTPSRRYHVRFGFYTLFLFLAPMLCLAAAVIVREWSVWWLAAWAVLLMISTCAGAEAPTLRYLHPFSLLLFAAVAILADRTIRWTKIVLAGS